MKLQNPVRRVNPPSNPTTPTTPNTPFGNSSHPLAGFPGSASNSGKGLIMVTDHSSGILAGSQNCVEFLDFFRATIHQTSSSCIKKGAGIRQKIEFLHKYLMLELAKHKVPAQKVNADGYPAQISVQIPAQILDDRNELKNCMISQ